MVIVELSAALGNQIFQYAVGKCIAQRLKTELKLDLHMFKPKSRCDVTSRAYYRLGAFNISGEIATAEEVAQVKKTGLILNKPFAYWNDLQGDILVQGYWMFYIGYFDEVIDIIRKEFTLKEPLSPNAEAWNKKILSAECSVSMHFRHGDKLYDPVVKNSKQNWTDTLPIDYYLSCLSILKQRYNNLTVFAFSDNISWVKENLQVDVPIEFVEGNEKDVEEWILMSRCKYNICANSSFSKSATYLNSNPDKRGFLPYPATEEGFNAFLRRSTSPAEKLKILDSNTYIGIPYNLENQPHIKLRPYYSLLLVVNNDAATIASTLDSLLAQDYEYYEVIIIDNASTDGSREICRQKIEGKENVIFKKFHSKVTNAKAWNVALEMAQGYYVFFLKGNDRLLSNALSSLFPISRRMDMDFIHSFAFLEENEKGTVIVTDKKYSAKHDLQFQNGKQDTTLADNNQEVATFLLTQQINNFLGTKLFYREFLLKNKIKFDKQLEDNKSEMFFQINAFFHAKFFSYISNAFYIAPKDI